MSVCLAYSRTRWCGSLTTTDRGTCRGKSEGPRSGQRAQVDLNEAGCLSAGDYQRIPVPVNRWNDGPTLSIREGESVREATLRALQEPLPPGLHAGSRREDPTSRRTRYLRSSSLQVSDVMLWDFLRRWRGELMKTSSMMRRSSLRRRPAMVVSPGSPILQPTTRPT